MLKMPSNEFHINADHLFSQIDSILTEYAGKVNTTTKDAIKSYGKDATKEVKKAIKASDIKDKKYSKGWTATWEGFKLVIHNKKYPGLVHLLEDGHRVIKNGIVYGSAKPHKHVSVAREEIDKHIREMVEKEIKNIQ